MILRTWRGWVRTERASEYVAYVERTGVAAYTTTPGNRGAQLATRNLDDGRTEIVTLSWWGSMDDIRRFAGGDPEVAVFYPDDDQYLVERERFVTHYIVDGDGAPGGPAR